MSQAKTSLVEVADSTDALKTARSEPIQQEQPRQTMNFIRSLVLDIPVQDYKDTTETAPMNIERILETQLEAEVKKIENPKDKIDTITVDVPLMIRLLEYAREDAKTDMDLHDVTEKLIALSKENSVLSMDQYDTIVSDPQTSFASEPQSESVDLLKKLAGIR
jgi:hypothetical protein